MGLRIFMGIAVALFVFSCSDPYSDLPIEDQKTIRKINKQIKQIENRLKFMVLEKEKASEGKKKKYIKDQERLTKNLTRLKERRHKILKKVGKATIFSNK